MFPPLPPSPNGGEGGAAPPSPNGDAPGGTLFERLIIQLDKRDAQLLNTLRADLAASLDQRLKSGDELAASTARRVVTATLHQAAEAAGAHDVETIERLIARDRLTIDDTGAVSGVEAAIAQLKQAKPFLFRASRSTGGTAKTPQPAGTKSKSAKDLSPAEWQAEKKRLGVRS